MKSAEAFRALCADIIGLPIGHIWQGYGSAIFMEIGDLSPVTRRDGTAGNPQGVISLGVEWSWRVENANSIVCGSWSEEDLWQPAFDQLRQAEIIDCQTFGFLPEIVVTTAEGLRFVTFSTADGQPRWHLVDRRSGNARWYSVRDGQLHLGDGTEPAI